MPTLSPYGCLRMSAGVSSRREADAGGVVAVPEPLERDEDGVAGLRRNARSAVDDAEFDPVTERAAGQR